MLLVVLTIAIVILLPKVTKAVPSSLVAIIVVFWIVLGFKIDKKQLLTLFVQRWFPPFHIVYQRNENAQRHGQLSCHGGRR
jgi:SulP family sulfate permease